MQIILAGHGKIAVEMKNTIGMIAGEFDNLYAIEFIQGESVEDIVNKYARILNNNAEQVIIITDLFAGSPYNAAAILAMQDEQIEVLTGLSLPLCLEVLELSQIYSNKDIFSQLQTNQLSFIKSFKDISKNMIADEEDL